jgi:hypothetical protein
MAVVYKNENFKLLSFSMDEAWKIMLALKKGSMVVKKKTYGLQAGGDEEEEKKKRNE